MGNTLEEIENDFRGNPPKDSTSLIANCYYIRKKDLAEFTIEDYRLLIGQNISLETLIPRALTLLKYDFFAEGDYYEGDLLKSVLSSDSSFWEKHSDLKNDLINLFESNIKYLEEFDTTDVIKKDLYNSFEQFKVSF